MRPVYFAATILTLTGFVFACNGVRISRFEATPIIMHDQLEVGTKRARVELDIFSGRTNPSWSLSEKDTVTLATMIEKLPPAEPESTFDGLGYRGFIVSFPAGEGSVANITVYRQIVRLDSASYRKDSERTVERWLLTQARTALGRDYESVQKEIEVTD